MEESNGSSTAIGTVVATAQNVVTAVVTKRTVTIASDSDLVREADRVLVAATDAMARATLLPELACYYNRFRNAQGVAPTLCLKPVRIVKIGFNISRVALSDATDATRYSNGKSQLAVCNTLASCKPAIVDQQVRAKQSRNQ